ncbi:hypothetical protein [Wolinella succinogenes]|uniref:hypothetical protein n=1 Tax=Wolinella succinogenes TaxID=844 RepID=UPI0002E5A798|nr:hypothetical protein [Wolinella succinogenes]VEG80203.1 Uncharacterised protein [Wolinella succinogenes]HCZ17931.1 hypothetical protein [Helicobacter sp.]
MNSNPLQIEYDSSTQTLTLTTPMNHRIIIRESSDSLLIQDSHQNQLTFDSKGISLESQGDLTLRAKGDIKIEATHIKQHAETSLSLKGKTSAELSAFGQTTIKGAMVMIN